MTEAMTMGWGGEACSGQVIPLSIPGPVDIHWNCWATSSRRHGARRNVCCEGKECWLKMEKECSLVRKTVGSSADHAGSGAGGEQGLA